MVDYGIILGLLGVASGAASLIYSRSQVVAARRQAEQATRATLLESNREISVRLQQIRARFFKVLRPSPRRKIRPRPNDRLWRYKFNEAASSPENQIEIGSTTRIRLFMAKHSL